MKRFNLIYDIFALRFCCVLKWKLGLGNEGGKAGLCICSYSLLFLFVCINRDYKFGINFGMSLKRLLCRNANWFQVVLHKTSCMIFFFLNLKICSSSAKHARAVDVGLNLSFFACDFLVVLSVPSLLMCLCVHMDACVWVLSVHVQHEKLLLF